MLLPLPALHRSSAPRSQCIRARFPRQAPSGHSGCWWSGRSPAGSSRSQEALRGDTKPKVHVSGVVLQQLRSHSLLTSLWKKKDALDKLTGLPGVGQAGSVSLGVDRHHGDGVAGVGVEFIQHRDGGALRHLFLQTDMTTWSCDL